MTARRTAHRAFVYLSLPLILLAVSPAMAAVDREDGAPASALGVADSVRATAAGSNALFFNPAGMSAMRQYAVEAGYSFLDGTSGHALGVSAVDSATNSFLGMGLAYTFITGAPGGRDRDGHQFRGALSTGYRGNGFSIFAGVGARYLTLDAGKEDSASNGETDDVEFFSLDAGLLLQISSFLRVGVVGHNLIDTKATHEAPRSLGVGLAFVLGQFQLSADVEIDLQSIADETTTSFCFGAQYMLKLGFVIRAGFKIDNVRDQKRFAVGLSYVTQRIAGDLAYSRTVAEMGEDIVSAGFRVFLP